MVSLRIVSSHPDFFGHDGRTAVSDGEAFGCNCAKCGREVSAPFGYEGKLIWCLYCGMDGGFVPAVESPWPSLFSFGVTRDECIEDHAALARGDFDDTREQRAIAAGKVIAVF